MYVCMHTLCTSTYQHDFGVLDSQPDAHAPGKHTMKKNYKK